MGPIHVVVLAEGVILEAHWTSVDGSVHLARYTIPPVPVRLARYTDAVGGPGGRVTIETQTTTPS